MKKRIIIKKYTNDSDYVIYVYSNQEPNPENQKFWVAVVDSCGIDNTEIKDKFKDKNEALKYAEKLNEQYNFE